MKVSDFIVRFIEAQAVTDVFGYQGTMITHFVDSVSKSKSLRNHSVYNEQAAAFAACGYAKATGKCAVAYSTSGPGALNLISGIADAYYDSVPVMFLTGQVNTTEYTSVPELRQQAFQQVDVVSIASPVTKYAVFIRDANMVPGEMKKAWEIAISGRMGPVLLDVPMNIQRSEIDDRVAEEYFRTPPQMCATCEPEKTVEHACQIMEAIREAERPVLVLGNGIGKSEERERTRQLVRKLGIPTVSSLLGKSILREDDPYYHGSIGSAYGHRCANWIAYQKADLIIGLGVSLVRRQIGGNSEKFAEHAKIIRVDIDRTELRRKVHRDEIAIVDDVNCVIKALLNYPVEKNFSEWNQVCTLIQDKLSRFDRQCDDRLPNQVFEALSQQIAPDAVVAIDVGQHMMWAMQSFAVKNNRLLFSGGHGAMGFSLPAAIGAYFGTGGALPVLCIAGDGAFQMNIQELQWIAREQLPICMIIMNNNCLGLIRQQQEDFFGGNLVGALSSGGFTSPDFHSIALAYGIESYRLTTQISIPKEICKKIGTRPLLLEFVLPTSTLALPKTYFGESLLNQRPYIPNELYQEINVL